MILDSHIHIGKTEKTIKSYSFVSYYEYMKKHDVDSAIVMPNLSSIVGTSALNISFMSRYCSLAKEFKKIFYPFILIDPRQEETLSQIDDYENLIYGVKYHPSISETRVNDSTLFNFFESAQRYNLIVLVHCGRNPKSNLIYLMDVAKKFSAVTFIGAHMGGNATDLVEDALNFLGQNKLDNVYLDTSSCELPRLIEKGVRILGADKILFGSDEPYRDFRINKVTINFTKLKEEEKNQIFYENARKLLDNIR